MAELLKVKLAAVCRKMRCNRPDTLAIIRIFSDPEICIVFFFPFKIQPGQMHVSRNVQCFSGQVFSL